MRAWRMKPSAATRLASEVTTLEQEQLGSKKLTASLRGIVGPWAAAEAKFIPGFGIITGSDKLNLRDNKHAKLGS
jgi:hypothetical protein